ncbi:FadR/GntR family transcriptional regulator [Spelaeicoccus albus]
MGVRLELEPVTPGSPASEVARQLLQLLTDGELAPGSRLPPERSLAESLGVGRSAVREALAALEILGVVQVRAGSGTYLQGSASDLLPRTLSWGLILAAPRTEELLEIRSSLERTVARTCAENASRTDVDELQHYVDGMSATLDTPREFIEADVRFHASIAKTAGNEVLGDLLQTIRSLIGVWAARAVSTRAQAAEACRQHQAVLDAIAAHDPDRAERAMQAHMTTATRRVVAAGSGND